jgi:hypothetical protein
VSGSNDWTQICLAKNKKIKLLLGIVALIVLLEIVIYFNFYFGKYRPYSRNAFGANINETFRFIAKEVTQNETIYISNSIFLPGRVNQNFKPFWYTNILFVNKINPELYQQTGKIPAELVSYYNGDIKRDGILIRSKMIIVRHRDTEIIGLNPEKIPPQSKLLRSIDAQGRKIQIYRVRALK